MSGAEVRRQAWRLNLRNTPRDGILGSPAQRLFSRRLRTSLPMSNNLLKPKPLNNKHISHRLKNVREQKKRYFDKNARELKPLAPNSVVRMQTKKGFEKLAVVKSKQQNPRSYVVTHNGADYVRNRRHLLAVNEPKPSEFTDRQPAIVNQHPSTLVPSAVQAPNTPLATSVMLPPSSSPLTMQPGSTQKPPSRMMTSPGPNPSSSATSVNDGSLTTSTHDPRMSPSPKSPQPMMTRSGRVVKPNPRYIQQ